MNNPLYNRKIVVTRSRTQAAAFIEQIEKLGGLALPFPTVSIEDPQDWQACDHALGNLSRFDWLVFTSFNGANYFLKRLQEQGHDAVEAKIAAVGEKTAAAVRSFGFAVDLVPHEFSSEGILRAFGDYDIKGKRFLLPTSNIGREALQKGLEETGARVDKLVVYRTAANRLVDAKDMRSRIKRRGVDCITFFSPSAFNFFIDIMGRTIIGDIAANSVQLAAVGPVTARAMQREDLHVAIQAERSHEDDLIRSLIDFYS
ncbi:MAG: uroporphyrinogen-III synthase [Candidatus Latescibacterota bacterium]